MWSLQAQHVPRTSGLIIGLKRQRGSISEILGLWPPLYSNSALFLFSPQSNPAIYSHLHTIRQMGDTQHNSSLWSLPVSLQNLIWFPMQQDKNHIKLQGVKKQTHNPTSYATHRICIWSQISFTASAYVLQISTVAGLSSPPSAQPLLVLQCEIEVDKCERII